ncbi:MAG: RCC1 domain-containing protein, partial [Actinomycetes bacterium]
TNTGTVPLAASGTLDLSVKNFVGTTQVVVDVLGYFTTAGTGGYTALASPCRAVDTRSGGGALGPDVTRSFQVGGPGSLAAQGGNPAGCGVPDGAGAVEIAVTAVGPAGNGFLRAFAAGDPVPNATFVNYTSGVGITNTGTVPLAASGTLDLSVKNFVGTTQVVVDVLGYFTTSATASDYVPITPCRAVDTRLVGGTLTTGAGAQRAFRISGTGSLATQGGAPAGCGVPDAITAAVVSVTAVSPVGAGFLRAGPNDGTEPAATVVNYTGGTSTTNTGATRLDLLTAQDLAVRNFLGSTHVVVDVVGYFTEAGLGSRYQTVTPCRAVDTRFAPGGKLLADTTRLLQISSERNAYAAQGTTSLTGCGVPLRAAAATLSVTAVNPAGNGFARAYPAGTAASGTVLNFTTGRSTTNTGAATLGTGGLHDLALRSTAAASDFVVDVLGYYEASRFIALPSPAKSVSVGGNHACRTAAFGRVECWGGNGSGQLGSMRTSAGRSWPAPVLGLYNASDVSSGLDHTCALVANGSVRCWGENGSGQLGDNTVVSRSTPAAVTGLLPAVQIAAGSEHTCALMGDRNVRCWGGNGSGQLGDGTTTQRNTPVLVNGLNDVAAITADGSHTCALLVDGTARCWGDNNFGELGDGTTTQRLTPVAVSGLNDAISLSAGGEAGFFAGDEFTCAVVASGNVRCWGANTSGQVGDGTTTQRLTPVTVPGLTGALAVTAGGGQACALLADAVPVKCWGDNTFGQLGDTTTTNRTTPVTTNALGLLGTVAVSAGPGATCAIAPAGQTACWGSTSNGLQGNGTSSGLQTSPLPLAFTYGATAVTAGASHTCAIVAEGSLKCWGLNTDGQLGDNTTTNRNVPTFSSPLGSVAVSAGTAHTCALRFDGTARCWGDNTYGQVGDGTTVDRLTAVPVGGVSGAVAITTGTFHSCALLSNGTARCWGDNANGQLGDGTTTQRNSSVAVTGLSGAVSISSGDFHTCAGLLDGTMRCWGTGAALGTGSLAAQLTPQPVTGLGGVFTIDAGNNHTCASLGNGVVFAALSCWGQNSDGRLGDGTTTTRTSPVPASALDNVSAVSAGLGHTCAVVEGGTAPRCWGDNTYGQLGDGTVVQRNSPTAVSSLTGVVAVATGDSHSCALTGANLLRCWGRNQVGQLGTGNTSQFLSPTGVVGLS